MKKLGTLIISATLLLSTTAFAPHHSILKNNSDTWEYENKEGWEMDRAHTKVGFTATHLLISEVEGVFKDYDMSIAVEREDFVDTHFKMVIQTASIDTDYKQRDEHLKSPEFFNVEKHPTIVFESTMFKWDGDKKYKMKGYLTINGVKRLETFEVKYGGKIMDPVDGLEKAGFKITGQINRYDYDLKWNIASAAESFAVGETVDIECNLRLVRDPRVASDDQ